MLEPGRPPRDVADSIKTRGQNFSDRAGALFAPGGAGARYNWRAAATGRPSSASLPGYRVGLLNLFTGGYTIFKIVSGYRDHLDALVVFGRNVRHEAEAHHWRYEVVSAKDEGLLLYLRKTHFIEPDRAVIEWNRGNLDALVASTEKAPALVRRASRRFSFQFEIK